MGAITKRLPLAPCKFGQMKMFSNVKPIHTLR